MSEIKKCPKCSGEMEMRFLAGYGYACKLLSTSDGMWLTGKREKVLAFACKECGFIELYREMEKKRE